MKRNAGMNLFLAGTMLLGIGASGVAYARGGAVTVKKATVAKQRVVQKAQASPCFVAAAPRMGGGMWEGPGRGMSAETLKAYETQLKKDAAELGVKTTGKTVQQIAVLVAEARIRKEAADLGVKVEGRLLDEVRRDIMEARVRKDAATYGVSLDGKDYRDAAAEIMRKKVLKAAKELGISLELRNIREVVAEIAEKYPDKLAAYGLDGYGPGFGMGRGMGAGMGRGMGRGMGQGMGQGRW